MARRPEADTPSNEQLACRAQQGCVASFEELARRLQVPLVQFLRLRAGAADAEDLAQDTLVRAYQHLDRYRPAWRFATWLFTIARRLSLNHQRRKRPTADSEALESLPAATPPPGQAAAEAEERRRLWDLAAEVLTDRQMTAVWLYYAEEMSVKEVARVLDRSRVAVRAILFRARKTLLGLVGSLDEEPPEDRPAKAPRSENRSRPSAVEVPHG